MTFCGYCTTPQACTANGCAYLANRPPHDLDARALKARLDALTVERDTLKAKLADAERGRNDALTERASIRLQRDSWQQAFDVLYGVMRCFSNMGSSINPRAREAIQHPSVQAVLDVPAIERGGNLMVRLNLLDDLEKERDEARAEAAALIKAADNWCFAYLGCNLVAVRDRQFAAPDRAIALAYALAKAAQPGPGAALLERVKKLEAVAKLARYAVFPEYESQESMAVALEVLDAPAAHDGDGDSD